MKYLSSQGDGPDEFDGEFQFEIATCEHADTGKPIDWPPKPLIVRGRFVGLPRSGR